LKGKKKKREGYEAKGKKKGEKEGGGPYLQALEKRERGKKKGDKSLREKRKGKERGPKTCTPGTVQLFLRHG